MAALALGGCHPADGPHKYLSNVVSVTGTGEFEAKPDIARITVGCESQSASAAEATQATTVKIAAILAAIRQAGVQDKDVQTAQLSIYSEQVAPPPPVPQPVLAPGKGAAAPAAPALPTFFYRATNTVSVTIRQIDRAGVVIGAAFAAGANQAGGIQFDVENHQPLEDQARAKAVADAAHRAAELARLSNVKLGRVLSVLEGDAADVGPQPLYAAKAAYRTESSVAPVEGGQIKVTYVVRVVYALGD